jgi:hypothetical protein
MDGELVDCVVVGLVVLHDFLRAQVVHADGLLVGAGEDQLVGGVERSAGDRPVEAVVLLHLFPLLDVPDE